MSTQADLQHEAAALARRCALDRADYLFEVAHCPHRGPDEAEQLRRLTFQLLDAECGQGSSDPKP